MLLRRAIIVLGSLLAAYADEPTIAFSGVLTADGKTRIAVTDKATDTTEWVEPGRDFNGYAINRYEPKEDVLVVKKGGTEYRLPLAVSHAPINGRPAAPAGLAAAGPAVDPTANAIRGNLRTLAAAARQYQAERGVGNVAYTDLVGPGKFIGEVKSLAGENYTTLNFTPNLNSISVTTANGAVVAYDLPPAGGGALPPRAAGASAPGLAAAPRTPVMTPPSGVLPAPAMPVPAASPPPPAVVAATTEAPPAVAAATPPSPSPPEALTPTGRETASPTYTIQGGDTWEKISGSTGVPVSELKRLNPVVNGSSLPSGQTIRIR
jgi:hypothetical protein